MIEYFEQLTQEEQEDLTDVIRLLYRQTFLLERKFDKRAGRLQYQIDFLKMYFQIAGITLCENVHLGLIYIQDEMVWGEKLPRLATIYILLLKLIYDEQMASVSSSSQIVTTLGALNGKAGDFRVLRSIPSPTEMKRTIAMLKKYQLIEPLDVLEELNESTRLLIYPCIHAVLQGDAVRKVLESFGNSREEEEETLGDIG